MGETLFRSDKENTPTEGGKGKKRETATLLGQGKRRRVGVLREIFENDPSSCGTGEVIRGGEGEFLTWGLNVAT